ncbi:MAG: hypothetical protein ACREOZ_05000 [Gloeomargaritales cyanobacterium]
MTLKLLIFASSLMSLHSTPLLHKSIATPMASLFSTPTSLIYVYSAPTAAPAPSTTPALDSVTNFFTRH